MFLLMAFMPSLVMAAGSNEEVSGLVIIGGIMELIAFILLWVIAAKTSDISKALERVEKKVEGDTSEFLYLMGDEKGAYNKLCKKMIEEFESKYKTGSTLNLYVNNWEEEFKKFGFEIPEKFKSLQTTKDYGKLFKN